MRGSDSAASGALILAIRDQARSHSDFVALCGSKLAREWPMVRCDSGRIAEWPHHRHDNHHAHQRAGEHGGDHRRQGFRQ